eukprot:1238-Heterococcus_DN1.PRE.3
MIAAVQTFDIEQHATILQQYCNNTIGRSTSRRRIATVEILNWYKLPYCPLRQFAAMQKGT